MERCSGHECVFSELRVLIPTIIKPKCIILSPIPLGGKKWTKIMRQTYKVSVPKLCIKMKKLINANQFLVSVRSGLTMDYSKGGTKLLQNTAVKFHSHLLMKIKAESAPSQGRGRQCHSQNDNMGASEPQPCWRSHFTTYLVGNPTKTHQDWAERKKLIYSHLGEQEELRFYNPAKKPGEGKPWITTSKDLLHSIGGNPYILPMNHIHQ